ncbi:conserved protein of unknown function [Candidatus Promineifilum breve]|uniref:Uncharacterized protein n=1 Tax=Candidatus Promineifilum breve TaxID=1806508 RepID=A0A170PHQ2_9CHLR|nr:hypothetical protein [Candidatus Promineifilum breve]CUS04427.2 conserved protein of unknown function [Candidatus Promineifilum breve]
MQVLDVPKVDRRARLAQLIRLYEQGQVSDLMDRTLYKLFSVEAAEEHKAINLLRSDLDALEARFGMESPDFFQRFENGEMGDDMDHIEWASLYQMYIRSCKRLELLTVEE